MGSIDDKLNGNKILIVDDEPGPRMLQKRVLERFFPEYAIYTADNGKIASEMIEKDNYPLVISDFDMPEMNGLELYYWIEKNKQPRPKFLLLSGDMHEERIFLLNSKGLTNYMEKPFDVPYYVSRVKNLLNGPA